jgi:redox-sensitive bicupin YhaK (pirin superfamily)
MRYSSNSWLLLPFLNSNYTFFGLLTFTWTALHLSAYILAPIPTSGRFSFIRDFKNQKHSHSNNNAEPSVVKRSELISSDDDGMLIPFEKEGGRMVSKIEKFSRLPVWPVWNGVLLFAISRIFGEEFAAKLEQQGSLGGRVCPNFFSDLSQTSPFIMLVHHSHSFAAWDPIRYLQRTFFPEGFPAHPHRGFITVTYVLNGGFLHRDSLGVKQTYGAEKQHSGKHTQWLMTGAGILHEEMWDIQTPNLLEPSRQELYQLWLNIPSKFKADTPNVQLLGGDEETPTVLAYKDGSLQSSTIVIAGSYANKHASIETFSAVNILHVTISKNATWSHSLPTSYTTAILYMRQGSAYVGSTRIPPHYTAYLGQSSDLISVRTSTTESADFLFLAGEPLKEPVVAQGSMVMNTDMEIYQAYRDYQSGKMGVPWDHRLSDDEWRHHLQKYPSSF